MNKMNTITKTENINLKEFKKEVKKIGYKVKTYAYNTSNIRHLEILDKNKEFVCGSGVNCYYKKTIEEHKKAFDLLNKYRNCVFDNDNNRVRF